MTKSETILILEANQPRLDERLKQIREINFNAISNIGIFSEDSEELQKEISIVMVHAQLLRGTGPERFGKMMQKLPEAAVIYMVNEEKRIGSLNSVIDGIYDYLLLPASQSHMSHVLDIAVDRRARLVLEKYYQKYLEEQVGEQLQKLADQQIQLLHQDRLSSIGQVAAGIIHELNNPLMYMKLNLETLEGLQAESRRVLIEYEKDHGGYNYKNMNAETLSDEIEGLAKTVSKGISNIERILGNMRRFSRRQAGVKTEFDLHQAISNALNFAKGALKKNIDIQNDFGAGIPLLRGDPQKLEQVFLNLIINGSHALEEKRKGVIKIKTQKISTNGQEKAQISISDNGPGIRKDILGKIFDPFFTTKPKEKGTGLGLSICREIASEFSGTLEVESEIGNGATFILSLPLKE